MCDAHCKSKTYPEFLCGGGNGSINLELVKSLLSLRMGKEKKRKRKKQGRKGEGGEGRQREREV